MRQRSKGGTVLTLADLFPLDILRHLRHLEYTVYTVGNVDESKAFAPQDVNPSLSFQLTRGNIFFFRYHTDLNKLVTAPNSPTTRSQFYKVPTATVVIHAQNHDSFANKYITDGIAIVLGSGLYQSNFQRDAQRKHISDLRGSITNLKGHFGLPQIVSFLATKGFSCALLHMPNVRSVQINVASSSPTALDDVLLAIGRQRPRQASSEQFFIVHLGESYGGRRLIDAARWGKPIILGLETDHLIKHILFAPLARPFLIPKGRQDGQSLVCRDIICLSLPSLNRKQIAEVQDYIEYFSYYRFTERRFEAANAVYRSLKSLREKTQPEAPLSRTELAKRMSAFAQGHLDSVLYTTSAHSITLRLFDPTRNTLTLVACASSQGGEVADVEKIRSIEIEPHKKTSVNVFTFIDGGANFDHVHLPRIPEPDTSPDQTKPRGSFIPKEYSSKGLQGALTKRVNTRSELCFPLMMGDICVGTMNCEAPIYHGFDDDISYLTTIKEGFEAFLSDLMGRFDITWLLRQGWRADAIHELWQYIETDAFECKSASLLKRLFPDPRTIERSGEKTFGSLHQQLLDWIKSRYGVVSIDNIFAMLRFRLPDEYTASSLYLDTLYFISRNMIQNAIQHTGIQGSVIYFDLVSLRRTRAVQIHFRTRSLLHHISESTIDQLILSPVTDGVGRKRYGMFIVGLLARLLGGTAQASYNRAAGELVIKVIVPIREVTE